MNRVATRRIMVRNISPGTTVETLKRAFAKYGEVREANISSTVNSRGQNFGFVEFASTRDAESAFDILQNTTIDGYVIFCIYCINSIDV